MLLLDIRALALSVRTPPGNIIHIKVFFNPYQGNCFIYTDKQFDTIEDLLIYYMGNNSDGHINSFKNDQVYLLRFTFFSPFQRMLFRRHALYKHTNHLASSPPDANDKTRFKFTYPNTFAPFHRVITENRIYLMVFKILYFMVWTLIMVKRRG